MSSPTSGNYTNPSLGLMDAVKGLFDRKDAKRDQQMADNESHRVATEHAAMQHQNVMEQMHAKHGYDSSMVRATGSEVRRNATHAARVVMRIPEGSGLSASESAISVSAAPAGSARKSAGPARSRSTAATKPKSPAAAKPKAPAAARPKTPAAAKPKTPTAVPPKKPRTAAGPTRQQP